MTEKKKRGRPRKNILDQAVTIPYTRSTSDDPVKQSMIDLMETGRCITEFKPDGIRRIDPLGSEAEVALYNAEHRDQLTQIAQMSPDELKERFPDAVKYLPHVIGRKPGVSIDVSKIRENLQTPKLYPPDNLSKTEKLAWLTKNRLK